jgi:tartrate-resistant acid phosphatase type 5
VRRKEASAELEPAEWVQTIGQTAAPWRIAVGHHPYLSNGPHGNAGSFKDLWLVNWRGEQFKAFFDGHVLGNVDLYLSGHDHNLQFFARAQDDGEPATALVVAGSTAKCGGAGRAENGTRPGTVTPAFEYYGPGFALVDVTADRLTVELHRSDDRGRWQIWRATATRGRADWEHDAAWSDLRNHCRP